MTPKKPQASMHEVVCGLFVPAPQDLLWNIEANFAATILLMAGQNECSQGFEIETDAAMQRASNYVNFLNFFGLDSEDGLECRHMHDAFSWEGAAGNINLYWQRKWDGTTYCYLDTWTSDYIIYYTDDYKKCVCDAYLNGDEDCP